MLKGVPSIIFSLVLYTGLPNGMAHLAFRRVLVPEKASMGVGLSFSCSSGVLFKVCWAYLTAYGQRVGDIACGHLVIPSVNIVRDRSCSTRIRRSATPFSKCAWALAKVSDWLRSWQWDRHALAQKVPLSAWYAFMRTPFSAAFRSKDSFPRIVSSAVAVSCITTYP